jgi:hypothetical protein
MKLSKLTVNQLAELAQEAEFKDPIDWGMLPIEEDRAYRLMATNVVEQFDNIKEEDMLPVAMATITKLLVENFVLNYQLENRK